MRMAGRKPDDRGSTPMPGTGDHDAQPAGEPQSGDGGVTRPVGSGLSGGVTDSDARDGEPDDSNSGYSDEDLMRTGGGGVPR